MSTAADRKQYGGSVMTSPEVGVRRPSSTLSRPAALVAVDIPLPEDSNRAGSARDVVEKGEDCFQKKSAILQTLRTLELFI